MLTKGLSFMQRLLDHLLDEWSEQSKCTAPGETICEETKTLAERCAHCRVRSHLLSAYHIIGDTITTIRSVD